MKPRDSGKEVREEPSELAQEGAFGLRPSELPEEGEGHDFRIRELFESLVAPSFGVELVVSVVYWTEQDGKGLFQEGQPWGKLGLGHLKLLWTGNSDGPRFTFKPRNTHLGPFLQDRSGGFG